MATTTMADEYEKLFKKGTIVEVSSEDEGLRGSWYTATVMRTISRKTNKILVEYHNLMANSKGSKPLREFVNSVLVRPIPPIEPNRKFLLMEDVDAFHNDGWWEGVVTQVLEGSSRYAVFFRCSREQIGFSGSDLRLHREWVGGAHWVPPLDPPSLSPGQKNSKNGEGRERNGNCPGGKRRVTSNGEERGVKRKSSNRSVNKDTVTKKRKGRDQRRSCNGTAKKGGVARNGNVKQPRKAIDRAGRRK